MKRDLAFLFLLTVIVFTLLSLAVTMIVLIATAISRQTGDIPALVLASLVLLGISFLIAKMLMEKP